MILSDSEIHEYGGRLVEPFLPENVQPASIDLRLARHFRVFNSHYVRAVDLNDPTTYEGITSAINVGSSGFVLHPGEFVLGCTEELVNMPDDLVGRVEGKSSLGRLGLIVHATAGFIDPGFVGRITLEMSNLLRTPIILHPGLLICQISLHRMSGPASQPYNGRYQGDRSVGASKFGINTKE